MYRQDERPLHQREVDAKKLAALIDTFKMAG